MPTRSKRISRAADDAQPTQRERGPGIWVPNGATERRVPHIHFRTTNGFRFWPVELPEGMLETESLRIRRGFEVQSPDGEAMQVAVDVTMAVRGVLRERIGRDVPPEDPLWDYICRSALSESLRANCVLPLGGLVIFGLTREQIVSAVYMAR